MTYAGGGVGRLPGPQPASRLTHRLDTRRLALGAGALCIAGMVAAVVAARADRGSGGTPFAPPGNWTPTFWVGVITAFCAYAAGVVLVARTAIAPRAALLIAAAVQIAPLADRVLFSGDVRTYVTYGRSPTPYGGSGINSDVYGPLWTAISRVAGNVGNGTFVLRALAACSVIAMTELVSRLAARKALAIAFLGWNPLVAFHFAGGGHNDALMMALVVGAIVLAESARAQLGGAAWATSVFVKWSSVPFYPLWAIDRLRRRTSIGLVGSLIAGAALAALSYALYGWTWLHSLDTLRAIERVPASFGLLAWLDDLGISNQRSLQLSQAAFLVALAFFAVRAWRGKLRLGLAAGTLTLLEPRLEPWYAVWCVALSAADDEDRWGKLLAVVLSGLLLSDVLTSVANA